MRLNSVKVLIQLFTVVILLSGCGATHYLYVSYAADPSRQSPLRTIPSLAMTIEVEEARPEGESDVVGVIHPLGFESGRYQTTTPPQAILLEGLRNEFANNGHKVVPVSGREADVRIVVRIRKFWIDEQIHLFSSAERSGTILAECAIINPIDGSIYGQRTVIGTFRSANLMPQAVVLNSALAEFIRSFSRDPEILEYLRLAQEEKKGK